ncbi:branched-chain amino acid ABC transporter permease [Catellatospora methionotrophica]|uniref:branched-chain amino acid ABC transporter permease n=1 Tax=Catellatospora methionotrophica TaxID=121620 RepID=UPI0034062D2C
MSTHLVVVLDGVCWGMLLCLTASGMALAYHAGATLNLAHGLIYLTGAYLAAALAESWVGLAAAFSIAAFGGAAAGAALAGLLRPLNGHLQQALATAGIALIGGHLLTVTVGADPLSVPAPPGLDHAVDIGTQPYPAYRLALVAVTAPLIGGLWWLLHRTRAGSLVLASAEDPVALALLGQRPELLRTGILAAATALAAVAGVLGGPLIGPAPGVDHRIMVTSLLIAVTAAGSIARTVPVAIAVGQMQTTALAAWPQAAPYLPYTLLAAVLLAGAVLRRTRPTR